MGEHVAHAGFFQGLKFFAPLRQYCDELHRQKQHPNRNLHLDEYLCLLLLAYFNPAISGLRQLVKLPAYPRQEGNLGFQHTSLASFSEASSVFDPEPLRRIFMELAATARAADGVPRPQGVPADLRLLAADATLWKLLPRMARELYAAPRSRCRKAELKGHFVFNVLDHVPVDVQFTGGKTDERHVLPLQLHSGALYLVDRGYQSRQLFQSFLDAECSFVARVRGKMAFQPQEERALTPAASAAGVTSDQCVRVPDIARPLRVVRATVVCPPSRNLDPKHKRGKHAAPGPQPTTHALVLLTDRLDLDAAEIVALYRYRWQIEIFFRWFKCVFKCRHLFAESPNGLALQLYAALIGSLLVVIYTGRKPNKQLLFVLQLYFQGWGSWAHVEAEIARAKPAAV